MPIVDARVAADGVEARIWGSIRRRQTIFAFTKTAGGLAILNFADNRKFVGVEHVTDKVENRLTLFLQTDSSASAVSRRLPIRGRCGEVALSP